MLRIVYLFVTLLFFSPLLNAQIYQEVDKFDGNTHFYTLIQNTDIEGGSFWSGIYVHCSWQAFSKSVDKDRPFILTFKVSTRNWIFIKNGKSLVLKFDDSEPLEISGTGSITSREVISGEDLIETASYYLSATELKRIIEAKTVSFRLFGEKQTITGVLSNDFIADGKLFLTNAPKLLGLSAEVVSNNDKSSKRHTIEDYQATHPNSKCVPNLNKEIAGSDVCSVNVKNYFGLSTKENIESYLIDGEINSVVRTNTKKEMMDWWNNIEKSKFTDKSPKGERIITNDGVGAFYLIFAPSESDLQTMIFTMNAEYRKVLDERIEMKPYEAPVKMEPSKPTQPPILDVKDKEVKQSQDTYGELIKLDDLRKRGILSQAEFDSQKKILLEKK
jgi:hypothetical protein